MGDLMPHDVPDPPVVDGLQSVGAVEGRLEDTGREGDGIVLRHVVGVDDGGGHDPASVVTWLSEGF